MKTRGQTLRFSFGVLFIALALIGGIRLLPALSGAEESVVRLLRSVPVVGKEQTEEEPFVHPSLSGPERTLDSQYFRIHYTLTGQDAVAPMDADSNGHPDYVDEVARTLEHVRRVQVEQFGWVAPPGDGRWGGDSRYDVYLHQLEDALGYVDAGAPETIVGDNPNSPGVIETRAGFSVMGLDNDYSDVEGDPLATMRATAAHEYHHAIQAGYDAEEPMDWLWEAAATWMQDEVYDDNNESREELETIFKAGATCQLAYGGEDAYEQGGDWYGLWILLRTISERYGHETVRAIWEAARVQDGHAALDTALAAAGTDLDSLLEEFGISLLLRDFEEGATYPTVRLEGQAGTGTFQPERGVGQTGQAFIGIDGDGVITVKITAQGSGQHLAGTLVGLQGQQATLFPLSNGTATVDAAPYDHLYLMIRNPMRGEAGTACRLAGYTVQISPGGKTTAPIAKRPAPHFSPPDVEPPLDSNFAGNFAGNFDGDEAWGEWEPEPEHSALTERLAGQIPKGVEIEDIFVLDAMELDEAEAMWSMPGGNGALALLRTESGADVDILMSHSPFADLSAWLAAVDYEPLPGEIRSIAGVPLLLEVWDDDYTSITLIHNGNFYAINGQVSPPNLLHLAERMLLPQMGEDQ